MLSPGRCYRPLLPIFIPIFHTHLIVHGGLFHSEHLRHLFLSHHQLQVLGKVRDTELSYLGFHRLHQRQRQTAPATSEALSWTEEDVKEKSANIPDLAKIHYESEIRCIFKQYNIVKCVELKIEIK